MWCALSVFVLGATYTAPIAAVFRMSVAASPTVEPLPALATPSLPVPLLKVPKLKPLAALPPAAAPAHVRAALPSARAPQQRAARNAAITVPVVTDVHSQVAPSAQSGGKAATDQFAKVPVVTDQIGQPVALPASTAVTSAM